jgi:hypothetical protein
VGLKARGNVPELANTMFMVVIRRVPNGNNDPTSSMQFLASYTDISDWEELIDFIEKDCSPKEPYCLTASFICNMMQELLIEEYMEFYAPGQIMNDPIYGQISYSSSLSNALELKLGFNVN